MTLGKSSFGGVRLKITVRNGFIVDFTSGLELEETFGAVVENMHVNVNDGDGIRVGAGALLQHIEAIQNDGFGVEAGDAAYINDTNIQSNGKDGLVVGAGSEVYNASSIFNFGSGIVVDRATFSRLVANTAEGNKGKGIDVVCPTRLSSNHTGGQFFANGGEPLSLYVEDIVVPFATGNLGTLTHDCVVFDSDLGAITHHSTNGILR